MRKLLVAAAMFAGLAGPAVAQDGEAAKPKGKHWTWVAATGGTLGWEDGGMERDPASNSVVVNVLLYSNDPKPLPANAKRQPGFEGAGQTYDHEMRIMTYACGRDAMRIELVLYSSIINERSKSVAQGGAQLEQPVNTMLDHWVKKHVCDGVKPEGAGEAFGAAEMINVAATLEKRAREGQ